MEPNMKTQHHQTRRPKLGHPRRLDGGRIFDVGRTTYGHRCCIAIVAVLLCTILPISVTGQNVADPRSIDTLSNDPPKIDSTEDKIRRALDGGTDADDGTMLGGILGAIQERGSVLDGSSLDDDAYTPALPPVIAQESQFLVAEQLLKTSRLLKQIRPTDRESLEMVNQMRLAAVKLLTESMAD